MWSPPVLLLPHILLFHYYIINVHPACSVRQAGCGAMDPPPAQRDAPSHPTERSSWSNMGARRFFLTKNSSSLAGEELSDDSLLEEIDGSSISA